MRSIALLLAAAFGLAAAPAQALMVSYDWVPGPGSFGTGSMVFDLGSGTDGNNFSIPAANLVSFSFKFSNGSTVSLANLDTINVATGLWTAASGYLTTVAQLSDTIVPTYTFQLAAYSLSSPNPNGSTAVAQNPVEQNFGVWHFAGAVAPVPLPAAAWLLVSGLIGGAGFLRRRTAS